MTIAPQTLRKLDDLLYDLSKLTGLSVTQLEQQLDDLEAPCFEFEGLILVSPSMADAIVEGWANSLKMQLRQPSTGTTPSTPTKAPRGKRASSGTSRSKKAASKTPDVDLKAITVDPASLPSLELKVPRDVFKLVSTRYDVALRKVLPKDEGNRRLYLQHIVAETEQGYEFLMNISIVLAKKYKGRVGKETAYKRLFEKAQLFLQAA